MIRGFTFKYIWIKISLMTILSLECLVILFLLPLLIRVVEWKILLLFFLLHIPAYSIDHTIVLQYKNILLCGIVLNLSRIHDSLQPPFIVMKFYDIWKITLDNLYAIVTFSEDIITFYFYSLITHTYSGLFFCCLRVIWIIGQPKFRISYKHVKCIFVPLASNHELLKNAF